MTAQRLQERSAEMGNLSMDEWRKAVLAKLQTGDTSMKNAAKFLSDRNWTGATPGKAADPSAFGQLINAQGYSKAKGNLPSSLGMMKFLGKDLIYDMGWQPRTSVSYVTRYTPADKKAGTIPAGKKIGDVKTEVFTNPEEEPGIVARQGVNAGLGSFVRVGDASNPLRYSRVIDAKPGGSPKAEINNTTGQNLGNTNFNPNASTGSTTVDVVSANPSNRTGGLELPLDAKLNNEYTQYAGYLSDVKKEPYANVATQSELTKTMAKYKDDPAFQKYQRDVKEALEKQKQDLEKAKKEAAEKRVQAGGGDRVETGVVGVYGGPEMRQVVTVTSPTQSGDMLAEGRYGTYAGMQRMPVSTLGSLTVQSQAVVTALDNVFVDGTPTAMPA